MIRPERAARGRGTNSLARPEALPSVHCELCNEPASEHDYSYAAQMVVCPQCLETLTEQGVAA